jgi:pyridoxamine 5'-phosphate oxidase
MSDSPAAMRMSYELATLLEAEALPNPVDQFALWFEAACKAGIAEPNAMALATADAAGQPSVRIVLLKGFDTEGFVFFTNFESRKAAELAANPRAALLFWWDRLHRQVRLEGPVERTRPAEADGYFAARPYGSRIGAWASPQSRVIEDRAVLETREAEIRERFPEGAAVPRPPYWGGYRLRPDLFEFWQGRPSRLHDRLRYRRATGEQGVWVIERLAP